MLDEDSLEKIYEKGYCPVCLTSRSEKDHSICKIFSSIDPRNSRCGFSRQKLNKANKYVNMLTLGLYGVFVPWDLKKEQLDEWFKKIEYIILCYENNSIPDFRIEKGLNKINNDFYTLSRIIKENTYGFKENFFQWDLKRPMLPVEFFSYELQKNNTSIRKEIVSDPNSKLDKFCRFLVKEDESFSEHSFSRKWNKMNTTSRKLYYYPRTDKVISIRILNGRPILASAMDIMDGDWVGWELEKGDRSTLLKPPKMKDFSLENLKEQDRIITRYNRLSKGKGKSAEKKLKNVVEAHDKKFVFDHIKDKGKYKSNIEILSQEKESLFQSLEKSDLNTNFNDKKEMENHFKKDPKKSIDELQTIGEYFIKTFTKFDEPRSKYQARALGLVVSESNILGSVIMPTGEGKSLIPLSASINSFLKNDLKSSSQENHLIVVVCPLIALLDDQEKNAKQDTNLSKLKNNNQIASLNHTISTKEYHNLIDDIKDGNVSLLFLTAEQLQKEKILKALSHVKIDWLFIDEAHGILDFSSYRPAYARLSNPIKRLKNKSPEMGIILQSATFPESWVDKTWDRLIDQVDKNKPIEIRADYIRTNLRFKEIEEIKKSKLRNEKSADRAVKEVKMGKTTILYSLYKDTSVDRWSKSYFKKIWNTVKQSLKEYEIGYYHGDGCKVINKRGENENIDRNEFVKKFSNGKLDFVLATSAFGLGINRDDVESIIFNGVPNNLNSLYQQAGRAARGVDEEGDLKYNGSVYIYYYRKEDMNHQFTLTFQNYFWGTTISAYFERMLTSPKSIKLGTGLYLLNIDENTSKNPLNDISNRNPNKKALRDLTESNAINWITNFPEQIIISTELVEKIIGEEENINNFYREENPETIEIRSKEYLEIDSFHFFNFLSESEIHDDIAIEDINKIKAEMSKIPNSMKENREKYSLISWTWNTTKKELERQLNNFREKKKRENRDEMNYVIKFLNQSSDEERYKILMNYYNIE